MYDMNTGCSGKNVFFTIHCNPSLAYIAVEDLQSSQRKASVQSLLLAGNFFVQPIAAECWRGRGGKLSRILGKNAIFNEHPVYQSKIRNEFSFLSDFPSASIKTRLILKYRASHNLYPNLTTTIGNEKRNNL